MSKPKSNDNHTATTAPAAPDAFMTRAEAATFCRLNVQTIDAAIKAARLRCYRVGRRVLLQKPDVLAWMQRQEA